MLRRPHNGFPTDEDPREGVDEALDPVLRDALLQTEVPVPSPDFDAKVLAAVRGHSAWRDLVAAYFRPAMATAAASAVVTILLMEWPAHMANPAIAAAPPAASASAHARAAALRKAIESPSPTYTALSPLRDAAQGRAPAKKTFPKAPPAGRK